MKKIVLCVALVFVFSLAVNAKSFSLKIIKNVGPLVLIELPIGEEKLKFLVDSGSNANFIDPKSIKKLDSALIRDKKLDKSVNTFSGKKKSLGYRLSFGLGMFNYENLETYVMNTAKFNKKQDGIDCCDGILGANFIKNFPVEIDLKNNALRLHQSIDKKLSKFQLLPIEIKGKDTIVVSCKLGESKLSARLDSGNEVPIVFQREGARTFQIREALFGAGYSGKGLPFFRLSQLNCHENTFKDISATFYHSEKGALSHRAVMANLGAHILGDHYIFDLKNKRILYRKEYSLVKKMIDGLKHYEITLKRSSFDGHPSIIDQTIFLILNSCSENSTTGECLNFLCRLENNNCVFKESGNLMNGFMSYYYPVKARDCGSYQLINEISNRPARYNYCWFKLSELNKKPVTGLSRLVLPKRFAKVSELEGLNVYQITSPRDFLQRYYCFYVYKGVISPKTLPPSLFPLSVKGGSYRLHEAQGYEKWRSSAEFGQCAQTVEHATGLRPEKKIKIEDAIFINPFTLLGDGVDKFEHSVNTVINHEALHILYAKNETMQKKAKKMWDSLSNKDKEAFKKKHSSYDFTNLNTAYREYFSYYFETRLDELL